MLDNEGILLKYLSDAEKEMRLTYKTEYPLSTASTFKIGGPAAYAVFPRSVDELSSLCAFCRSISVPFIVIGNGSNLLFDDSGYEGVVIFTTELKTVSIDGTTVFAECGVSLTHLSSLCGKEGLSGLEFAYGIPGSVGGAVYMNAGAYGGEMKDVILSVDYYDLDNDETGSFECDSCAFEYRGSIFNRSNKIILSSKFKLTSSDKDAIKEQMEEYMRSRIEKQPLNFPSAGSTFKRYPGYFTAKLIDDASLKGFSIGGAQVSPKHAGFIVNTGNATSDDVKALIEHIKAVIKEKVGIDIECEVKFISDPKGKV